MSDDIDVAEDHLKEAGEERKPAHARTAAVLVAALAAALAITDTAAKRFQTAYIAQDIAANDLWTQYQAKSVRRVVYAEAATVMAHLPGKDDAENRKAIDKASGEAARMKSDPGADGMEQLSERAKKLEEARDASHEKGEGIETCVSGLQLSIVLASVSVVTAMPLLMIAGGIMGLAAIVGAVVVGAGLIPG